MKMNKKFQYIFIVVSCVVTLVSSVFSQEMVLKNVDVVDLVKAGLAENIIIAKIKSAETDFDTSTDSLIKLKGDGVQDNVVLAMVEAKGKSDKQAPEKTLSQKTADLKEAVGRRKVYLFAEDEESKIELIKRFSKKGFSFVDDKKECDLIFELTYSEGTTQTKASIFRPGSESQYGSKQGKFVVKLKRDPTEYLVYAREYDFARASSTAAIFGVSAAMPSLKNQVKYYFVDDFIKQLKKAGDKID